MGNQAKATKTAEEYHNDASCPPCGQTVPSLNAPTNKKRLYSSSNVDIRTEEWEGLHKAGKIEFGIAVKHPQGADVWVGMWPPTLKQTL